MSTGVAYLLSDGRRWTGVMIMAVIVGGFWIWYTAPPHANTTNGLVPSPREGFLAPDFTLETLDGQPMSLSELRGQVVMINFWASLLDTV